MYPELSRMRLESERLIIRPYTEEDLMESFELMQHPELFTYLHMDVPSLDEYRGLFQWLIGSYETPFHEPFKYSFAVRSRATGAFIGWCGVLFLPRYPSSWPLCAPAFPPAFGRFDRIPLFCARSPTFCCEGPR